MAAEAREASHRCHLFQEEVPGEAAREVRHSVEVRVEDRGTVPREARPEEEGRESRQAAGPGAVQEAGLGAVLGADLGSGQGADLVVVRVAEVDAEAVAQLHRPTYPSLCSTRSPLPPSPRAARK